MKTFRDPVLPSLNCVRPDHPSERWPQTLLTVPSPPPPLLSPFVPSGPCPMIGCLPLQAVRLTPHPLARALMLYCPPPPPSYLCRLQGPLLPIPSLLWSTSTTTLPPAPPPASSCPLFPPHLPQSGSTMTHLSAPLLFPFLLFPPCLPQSASIITHLLARPPPPFHFLSFHLAVLSLHRIVPLAPCPLGPGLPLLWFLLPLRLLRCTIFNHRPETHS